MSKGKVTFVLPGRNRSGGVRVTAIMANKLLDIGYETRIVYKTNRRFSSKWVQSVIKNVVTRSKYELQKTDWLHQFKGSIEQFVDIQDIRFIPGEVVIAVGLYTIHDVRNLNDKIIKIRYNHGFSVGVEELTRSAWGGSMPTIVVASTLIDRVEKLSQERVLGVVPNGIDPYEYFVDNTTRRDGIGIMYSSHPNKCPHDIVRLMREIGQKWPNPPQYYFGTEKRPRDLEFGKYTRYPSVEQARDIYNSCVIWLSTSQEEGLPGPILEAMACGCAVVSADNLGARELIQNGENGFIVPVGDIGAFLCKIKLLLYDTQLRQKFITKGFATVQRFSWENAVQSMDKILLKVRNIT
jgi:glycosyltransferase involved in cell wall biosynthesis